MANDTYTGEYDDESPNRYEQEGQAAIEQDYEQWLISVAAAKRMADESFEVGVAIGRAQKLCDQIEAEYGF